MSLESDIQAQLLKIRGLKQDISAITKEILARVRGSELKSLGVKGRGRMIVPDYQSAHSNVEDAIDKLEELFPKYAHLIRRARDSQLKRIKRTRGLDRHIPITGEVTIWLLGATRANRYYQDIAGEGADWIPFESSTDYYIMLDRLVVEFTRGNGESEPAAITGVTAYRYYLDDPIPDVQEDYDPDNFPFQPSYIQNLAFAGDTPEFIYTWQTEVAGVNYSVTIPDLGDTERRTLHCWKITGLEEPEGPITAPPDDKFGLMGKALFEKFDIEIPYVQEIDRGEMAPADLANFYATASRDVPYPIPAPGCYPNDDPCQAGYDSSTASTGFDRVLEYFGEPFSSELNAYTTTSFECSIEDPGVCDPGEVEVTYEEIPSSLSVAFAATLEPAGSPTKRNGSLPQSTAMGVDWVKALPNMNNPEVGGVYETTHRGWGYQCGQTTSVNSGSVSQELVVTPDGGGEFHFSYSLADASSSNSISHEYDYMIDPDTGAITVSSTTSGWGSGAPGPTSGWNSTMVADFVNNFLPSSLQRKWGYFPDSPEIEFLPPVERSRLWADIGLGPGSVIGRQLTPLQASSFGKSLYLAVKAAVSLGGYHVVSAAPFNYVDDDTGLDIVIDIEALEGDFPPDVTDTAPELFGSPKGAYAMAVTGRRLRQEVVASHAILKASPTTLPSNTLPQMGQTPTIPSQPLTAGTMYTALDTSVIDNEEEVEYREQIYGDVAGVPPEVESEPTWVLLGRNPLAQLDMSSFDPESPDVYLPYIQQLTTDFRENAAYDEAMSHYVMVAQMLTTRTLVNFSASGDAFPDPWPDSKARVIRHDIELNEFTHDVVQDETGEQLTPVFPTVPSSADTARYVPRRLFVRSAIGLYVLNINHTAAGGRLAFGVVLDNDNGFSLFQGPLRLDTANVLKPTYPAFDGDVGWPYGGLFTYGIKSISEE